MDWRVELADQPAKALGRAPEEDRKRLLQALDELKGDPRPAPPRIKVLKGVRERYLRLRVGDRRIVYRLDDEKRTLIVLAIIARGQLEAWLKGRR